MAARTLIAESADELVAFMVEQFASEHKTSEACARLQLAAAKKAQAIAAEVADERASQIEVLTSQLAALWQTMFVLTQFV